MYDKVSGINSHVSTAMMHKLFLLFIFSFSLITNAIQDHSDGFLNKRLVDEFDWRAYLELYPDLGKAFTTKEEAWNHFKINGEREGRLFPKLFPNQPGLSVAHKKLLNYVKSLDRRKVPVEERTLVIYNVLRNDASSSYEVIMNNLQIFKSAVQMDSDETSTNFYWFNVISEDNFLRIHLPKHQWNAAMVERSMAASDLFVHFRTITLLKHTLRTKFQAILFLNSGTRGPFLRRQHGEWLKDFHKLLFSGSIGLVGTTMNCEPVPYVHSNIFMIRSSVVSTILSEVFSVPSYKHLLAANITHTTFTGHLLTNFGYEIGLTQGLLKSNWNITTILYEKRYTLTNFEQPSYFTGNCLPGMKLLNHSLAPVVKNPIRWCDLKIEEINFFYWSNEILTHYEHMVCNDLVIYMSSLLTNLKKQEPSLTMYVPEAIKASRIFNLFRQYSQEIMNPEIYIPALTNNETIAIKDNNQVSDVGQSPETVEKFDNRVCFLIRTSEMHDMETINNNKFRSYADLSSFVIDLYDDTGIDDIVKSLLRQSDPNWLAIFFITDEKLFDNRLQQLLESYHDSRLQFFFIPLEYRPKYTNVDAGYTPTDFVLEHFLAEKYAQHQCEWFSTSNADNIYGTDVVHSIRNYPKTLKPHEATPDMILVPIDSRNFAELDYQTRKTKSEWSQYCNGIFSMLTLNELTYTVQPRPEVGKVDLAGAFLSTRKFLSERILFGNFTDSRIFACIGCQDGYMIEYLVKYRFWKSEQVPVAGLRSIIFHGPSPTWCIASGNIWFDHPRVNRVRCLPPLIVTILRQQDQISNGIETPSGSQMHRDHTLFDWNYFDSHEQICLRFNEKSYLLYSHFNNNGKYLFLRGAIENDI